MLGVVFFERCRDNRARLLLRQREMQTLFPIEAVRGQLTLSPGHHSPGSSEACGTGDRGVCPPIATIRSIAKRARAAISGGTVIRCSIRCSALNTLGNVVTFIK